MTTIALQSNEEGVALRLEPRERVVQVVEYSRYPRRNPGEARCVAYTRDRSAGGLGLDLREPLFPGELLRVCVRDIDGAICIDGLARVVWCTTETDGRARAGLAMLREDGDRPMMRVRRRRRLPHDDAHGNSHTFGSS